MSCVLASCDFPTFKGWLWVCTGAQSQLARQARLNHSYSVLRRRLSQRPPFWLQMLLHARGIYNVRIYKICSHPQPALQPQGNRMHAPHVPKQATPVQNISFPGGYIATAKSSQNAQRRGRRDGSVWRVVYVGGVSTSRVSRICRRMIRVKSVSCA